MTNSANPLAQFFRQPAIYLQLPSEGNHWLEGALDMPANREIPVYPMTAIDEITYRTPDALYNGQAVVSVVQSCVPAIKNAWKVPSVDLNAILLGIRIASSGHELEVSSKCPNCKHEQEYSADMRIMLGNLKRVDFEQPMIHGDLEIYFQPMTFDVINQINIKQFEQQKTIAMLTADRSMPEEEKVALLQKTLLDLTHITSEAISYSVAAIKTPTAVVTEREHIHEWLEHCDRITFNRIKDHVIELRSGSDIPPMNLACPECGHEYQQGISLDASSFFEDAS